MSASTGGPTMTCHDCREGTASGRVIYNEAHGAVLVCARCVDARAMFGASAWSFGDALRDLGRRIEEARHER